MIKKINSEIKLRKIKSTKISFSTTDNESSNKGCKNNQTININVNNNNLMIPIENLSLERKS